MTSIKAVLDDIAKKYIPGLTDFYRKQHGENNLWDKAHEYLDASMANNAGIAKDLDLITFHKTCMRMIDEYRPLAKDPSKIELNPDDIFYLTWHRGFDAVDEMLEEDLKRKLSGKKPDPDRE